MSGDPAKITKYYSDYCDSEMIAATNNYEFVKPVDIHLERTDTDERKEETRLGDDDAATQPQTLTTRYNDDDDTDMTTTTYGTETTANLQCEKPAQDERDDSLNAMQLTPSTKLKIQMKVKYSKCQYKQLVNMIF